MMTHEHENPHRDLTAEEIAAVGRRRVPADPASRRRVRAAAPARTDATAARELRDLADELRAFVTDRDRRDLELFQRGRVDVDGVTHWLYLGDPLTDPDAHRRQHELTMTLRSFMQELGLARVPATVRLVRRVDGLTWAKAPASQRVSLEHHPALAEARLRTYAHGTTLEVMLAADLSGIEASAALAHEARHAWHAFGCPPYRRREFADVRAAERDADAWAREALRRRGLPAPDIIGPERDLSTYAPPS